LCLKHAKPISNHCVFCIDASDLPYEQKVEVLSGQTGSPRQIEQTAQLTNPDSRVLLRNIDSDEATLGVFAECYQGLRTGDANRFIRNFWEVTGFRNGWVPFKSSSDETAGYYGGNTHALLWEDGRGQLAEYARATRERLHDMHESGNRSWGKRGIAFGQITLRPTHYFGEHYDNTLAVITPKQPNQLPALWAFCTSSAYVEAVRQLERGLYVTNASLVKVPFDLEYWQKVAAKKYPSGLPEPYSDDPTQWIFHGHPSVSAEPLQVAVARLLDYRWPAELDDSMRLSSEARELVQRCSGLEEYSDSDGIACIPSVRGEDPAAERLRALLTVAYGDDWSPAKEQELISATGSKAKDLDEWLCNDFFEHHCKLFHHRPFIWHIWDGRRRDGFHALVNYHKLAEGDGKGRQLLESLTYSYLGEWITRQKDGVKRGEGGAEDRLAAALELQKRLIAIIEGEPPFDIFVRWRPIEKQPIGWEPDINDGVRINIRPFMASDIPGGRKGAGVLRWKPNIKWSKDRGKEPKRPQEQFPWFWKDGNFTGDRVNDVHLTNEEKHKAREKAAKK
jgi:hypothetical protein